MISTRRGHAQRGPLGQSGARAARAVAGDPSTGCILLILLILSYNSLTITTLITNHQRNRGKKGKISVLIEIPMPAHHHPHDPADEGAGVRDWTKL